ncbi:MAG: low molecular weight phosphatase family protein [Rhodospirillaceae bacterium TMED8]|nr:low molecular weight phosphatase family protein [Magnetovibrio sp.]OUT48137.1 MAG: low molecular weight phosphatase family protein [Rhodospirillaceae bacterium TMED8]|tara:strand:+ start:435 stop:881 length:447 start_codon:yes stop_codon:yes gene_type:complete
MGDLPSAVLFACTMNSVRSPMAEGIMKFLHGTRIYVDSVGVRSIDVDGYAITVMDEIGIDISGHSAKTFSDLEDSYFDVIISLSPEAQHRAVEMTRVMAVQIEFWNTFDPAIIDSENWESRIEAYRQVRDQLMGKIKARFPGTLAIDT